MGVPLLVTTNGGFTYWPEIVEEGALPPLATVAPTKMEAAELQTKWQQWIDERPERKTKK